MFLKSVNNSQTYHKHLASRIGRANALYKNFYVSHSSTMRFLEGGEKYYICFVDNLFLFPTVEKFSKSVNI